jgi:hypothetical protein
MKTPFLPRVYILAAEGLSSISSLIVGGQGMLLNWVVLWEEIRKANGRRRHDPLADPLDRPEWCGLLWMLLLFSPVNNRKSLRKKRKTRRKGDKRRYGLLPHLEAQP